MHSQTINFNTVIIQQSEVTKSAQAEELKNVCLKGRLKHPHALFPGFPNCAHRFWRLSFCNTENTFQLSWRNASLFLFALQSIHFHQKSFEEKKPFFFHDC